MPSYEPCVSHLRCTASVFTCEVLSQFSVSGKPHLKAELIQECTVSCTQFEPLVPAEKNMIFFKGGTALLKVLQNLGIGFRVGG
jgi:hypothetical protein